MSVLNAVMKGKESNQDARERYLAKQFARPLTVSGLLQFMGEHLKTNGYGVMAPINQKNKHKITGFIKFLRNNSFTDKEIYEFVKECIEKWDDLMSIEIHTDNRKKYTLDSVPNIIDIVHCKSQIFNELNKNQDDIPDEEFNIWEKWGED